MLLCGQNLKSTNKYIHIKVKTEKIKNNVYLYVNKVYFRLCQQK